MTFAGDRSGERSEARHSDGWYADSGHDIRVRAGDQLFIRCRGGPCRSRLETFPPRLEIPERGGVYVLVDDGPVESWAYEFVGTFER
jgi:hypothetical protein